MKLELKDCLESRVKTVNKDFKVHRASQDHQVRLVQCLNLVTLVFLEKMVYQAHVANADYQAHKDQTDFLGQVAIAVLLVLL